MNRIKTILKYAILAPSSYNSQPWKFRIIDKNKIEVWVDFSKASKVIDPSARELYISGGAVVTNIEVAAKEFGYGVKTKIYRDKMTTNSFDKIADIFLSENGAKGGELNNILFRAIKKRQTNRRPFENMKIDGVRLEKQMTNGKNVGIKIYTDDNIKKKIGSLVASASLYWYGKENYKREILSWLRDDTNKNGDGIWQKNYNREIIVDNALERAIADEMMILSSPALAIIWSRKDDKVAWIETGMYLEKVLLKITSMNIQHAYFNSIVESNKHRIELGKQLGKRVVLQLVLRLGKAKRVRKSPRRKLSSFLID